MCEPVQQGRSKAALEATDKEDGSGRGPPACDGPGGRGFALGIGTVAFFVTPGWRSPTGLLLDDPLEGLGLSAEESAVLHAIMTVGSQSALEFLG